MKQDITFWRGKDLGPQAKEFMKKSFRLEPIEITEDDIWEIFDEFGESNERMGGYIDSWGLVAKIILSKLKGE